MSQFFSIKRCEIFSKKGEVLFLRTFSNEVIETLRTFCDLEGNILCF